MGDCAFTIPIDKVHFDITLRILAQRTVGKWRPESQAESGPFESKYSKFSQSWHGSSSRNIFLRYLSKLSDIWHFTICKIWRENCCDTPPIVTKFFLRLNVNNSWICRRYAQICKTLHLVRYFKMAAVGLGIYYEVHVQDWITPHFALLKPETKITKNFISGWSGTTISP